MIINCNNNIVLNKITNNLEELKFNFENNKVYKIFIMGQLFTIYINDYIDDKLFFHIGNRIKQCNKVIPVIVKIMDYYYKDFSIMEGNIICQKKY